MNITSEDILAIKKFHDILNRGYYCDSRQVTDVYNRTVRQGKTPVANTNCSTCIRNRVLSMVELLKQIEEKSTNEGTKESNKS